MNTHNKHRRVSNMFSEDVASVREGTKGRSSRLISLRNEAMCDRYFYHQKINNLHYAKCVEEMSNEFFISQTEVTKIMRAMADYLTELRKTPPTTKALKEKYPWLNWD